MRAAAFTSYGRTSEEGAVVNWCDYAGFSGLASAAKADCSFSPVSDFMPSCLPRFSHHLTALHGTVIAVGYASAAAALE